MFTIKQVQEAHAKVKSGADFPQYVQELQSLGVTRYEHHVTDGSIHYFGNESFEISSEGKYPTVAVADQQAKKKLEEALTVHQAGQTDYLTFCKQSASAGVDKWVVDVLNKACIYYDKAGNLILEEPIPTV